MLVAPSITTWGYMTFSFTMYDGYYDTSGSVGDQHMLTTVGVVARADKWKKFDKKWLAVLAEFGVSAFHMKKLEYFEGEYASWRGDDAKKAAFLSALSRVAKTSVNKVFLSSVDLSAWRRVDAEFQLTEHYKTAYSLAQSNGQMAVVNWLGEKKYGQDVVQLFVEAGDVGQAEFLAFMRTNGLPEPVVLPKVDPITKEQFTPFQVADLIAFVHRRLYAGIVAKGTKPPEENWSDVLKCVRKIPYESGIFDERSLREIAADIPIPRRI